MSAPVRIAIVDDQALVLKGLSALLGDLGIEIALEADDGAALLAALAEAPGRRDPQRHPHARHRRHRRWCARCASAATPRR